MDDAGQIRHMLIDRDIAAFVAGRWEDVADDFDADAFAGYSGAGGGMALAFPSLGSYRDSWLLQAQEFGGTDPAVLAHQLHAAQRIERLEVRDGRALATKVFAGVVDGPESRSTLEWTSYYFLKLDPARRRWLITGFAGYLPNDWTVS